MSAPTGPAIFPTFFLAGFECSTFVWKDRERKDYVAATGHDIHLGADLKAAMELGIGVVREAIRWPQVDLGNGRYDWSSVRAVQDCATASKITPIWDMCHYGLPDGCDPFGDECLQRFVAYCRAASQCVADGSGGPHFFTPINEITFFSAAGSDLQWMYPFAKGREAELKRALARMSIAGAKAIREVIPKARMVHVDPLVHAVPPADRPDLAPLARDEEQRRALEGWDMLAGRVAPELGGAPDILDIVGVNIYHYSQVQIGEDRKREILGPFDPRRKPLSEMLTTVWERYRRPVIIGETSGFQDNRAEWLRMTMEECLKALNAGVELHGVCIYPFIDVPDWWTQEWAKIGVYEVADKNTFERVAHGPYVDELRHWQQLLGHPTALTAEGFETDWGRVDLDDVRRFAREWECSPEARRRAEA